MEEYLLCGIAGIMLKHGEGVIGEIVIKMLKELQHRGSDSTGVAIYNDIGISEKQYILTIVVPDIPGSEASTSSIIADCNGNIHDIKLRTRDNIGFNEYLLTINEHSKLIKLLREFDKVDNADVLSIGRRMKIFKDCLLVKEFDDFFNISSKIGTHAIGHVRFSTESVVNRYFAHPLFDTVYYDFAVVHNGQITNYYEWRQKLKRAGFDFFTYNDSEVLIHYIVWRMMQGNSLEGALKNAIKDMDGPFSFIVSTPWAIGVAKDPLGLRPALTMETDDFFAIASEEGPLRSISPESPIHYLAPGDVAVFEIPEIKNKLRQEYERVSLPKTQILTV